MQGGIKGEFSRSLLQLANLSSSTTRACTPCFLSVCSPAQQESKAGWHDSKLGSNNMVIVNASGFD
jgi:hypothetical protein